MTKRLSRKSKTPSPPDRRNKPTNIGGWNPDKDNRFSVGTDTDGTIQYYCDGKPVSLADGFGALVGIDSIPSRISMALIAPREPNEGHSIYCGINMPGCDVCTCGKEN